MFWAFSYLFGFCCGFGLACHMSLKDQSRYRCPDCNTEMEPPAHE